MGSRAWMLRLAALMGIGSLAVHQLRYLLGYHHDAGAALAGQGHAYLAPLGTVLAGLLVLALAELVSRAARGQRSAAPRLRRIWAGSTVALLVVYCAQELLEGALATGHPGGLVGVAGHGGWLALPLALAIGLAIALLARGAGAVEHVERRPWSPPTPLAAAPLLVALPTLPVRGRVPRCTAARGPPLASA